MTKWINNDGEIFEDEDAARDRCYDMIEEESVRAFRIAQGNAVILNAGTWHYAPIACGRTTRTFILFDRDTPGIDVTVIDTGETLGVSWVLEH